MPTPNLIQFVASERQIKTFSNYFFYAVLYIFYRTIFMSVGVTFDVMEHIPLTISPSLNKQGYASGASFLLNIYWKNFTTTLLTARNRNMTFHIGFLHNFGNLAIFGRL